jgi:isoquinoline 1-oxidoreductase beta subunit
LPQTTNEPGGAGEFGVAASMAATACAYARATGTMPTSFPINHGGALGFEPYPTTPSIPQSPIDGLARAGIRRSRRKPAKRKPPARKPKTTAKKRH